MTLNLDEFVADFAVGMKNADARHPQAVNVRSKEPFQPGIGPPSEAQTAELVMSELAALKPSTTQGGLASGSRIDGSEVLVFAVVDLHRDPSIWQDREASSEGYGLVRARNAPRSSHLCPTPARCLRDMRGPELQGAASEPFANAGIEPGRDEVGDQRREDKAPRRHEHRAHDDRVVVGDHAVVDEPAEPGAREDDLGEDGA